MRLSTGTNSPVSQKYEVTELSSALCNSSAEAFLSAATVKRTALSPSRTNPAAKARSASFVAASAAGMPRRDAANVWSERRMSPSVFSLYTAVTAPFSSVYSRTAGLISMRMTPPVFAKGPRIRSTGSSTANNTAQAVAAAAMRKGRLFPLFFGACACAAGRFSGANSEGMLRTISSSSLSSFFFQPCILLSLL